MLCGTGLHCVGVHLADCNVGNFVVFLPCCPTMFCEVSLMSCMQQFRCSAHCYTPVSDRSQDMVNHPLLLLRVLITAFISMLAATASRNLSVNHFVVHAHTSPILNA